MDDLTAFVTARLGEDEAAARAADPGPWEVGPNSSRKGMVYVREEGDLLDSVGLTWREPVFTSQVPNKTRFRENAAHIARHDPARVLREVAAKRAHLAAYDEAVNGINADFGVADALDGVVRHDATAWSDHPGYRAAWRA